MDVDLTRHRRRLAAENAQLRERVAQLEGELAEQAARTNALLADAAGAHLLARPLGPGPERPDGAPGAAQFRALLRAVRWPLRQAKRLKRRLLG